MLNHRDIRVGYKIVFHPTCRPRWADCARLFKSNPLASELKVIDDWCSHPWHDECFRTMCNHFSSPSSPVNPRTQNNALTHAQCLCQPANNLACNDKKPLSETPKDNHFLLSPLLTLLICFPPELLQHLARLDRECLHWKTWLHNNASTAEGRWAGHAATWEQGTCPCTPIFVRTFIALMHSPALTLTTPTN